MTTHKSTAASVLSRRSKIAVLVTACAMGLGLFSPLGHATTGLLARSVEDCDLVDAVLTKSPVHSSSDTADLKRVRFAYAPRQHLADVDGQADTLFREALRKLKDAGAELVEIDLGGDFLALAARTTWPLFFRETMPAVREFLAVNEVPVSFEQIYADLGEHIRASLVARRRARTTSPMRSTEPR